MSSGTGLGLNITKSLVEMQGGSIWFQSKQGEGTTFHFTVPVAESQ
jgi:signal transduction histidine kinase